MVNVGVPQTTSQIVALSFVHQDGKTIPVLIGETHLAIFAGEFNIA